MQNGSIKNDKVPISKKVPVIKVSKTSRMSLSTSLKSHINKLSRTIKETDKKIIAKVFNRENRLGNSLDHIVNWIKYYVNVKLKY